MGRTDGRTAGIDGRTVPRSRCRWPGRSTSTASGARCGPRPVRQPHATPSSRRCGRTRPKTAARTRTDGADRQPIPDGPVPGDGAGRRDLRARGRDGPRSGGTGRCGSGRAQGTQASTDGATTRSWYCPNTRSWYCATPPASTGSMESTDATRSGGGSGSPRRSGTSNGSRDPETSETPWPRSWRRYGDAPRSAGPTGPELGAEPPPERSADTAAVPWPNGARPQEESAGRCAIFAFGSTIPNRR